MTAPARTAAFHALRSILARRTDLPAALAQSRTRLSDERDRALAAEIVTGTLRWLRSLDHLAAHGARRPIAEIDADVLVILRLSLYQLLHLDRVPAAAVVDDAVDLTRAARKASASGFVNAVLRGTLRQRHLLPLPARPADPADREAALQYFGITHSHPEWLVERWLDRYGFDAVEHWVRFNNETPALTLRANTLRASRDVVRATLAEGGVDAEPARYARDGLILTGGNPLRGSLDGSFVVQDEASQLVPLAVAPQPGETVLDLCAAPGGKTSMMAAAMDDRGRLVAAEVRRRRVGLLRETLRRSGTRCASIVHIAPDGPLPFAPAFDRVLVDAPCSGLGTIRRDPDIRWRRNAGDLAGLAAAQLDLLLRAAEVVSAGGRLVYATCSSEPEENDDVVAAFLARREDFGAIDLRADPAGLPLELLDDRGRLRTLPFAHSLEAFFAAALVRRAVA